MAPRDFLLASVVAAVVFAAALGSYSLALGGVVGAWFPAGIVLGWLLVSERRAWPWVLLGDLLGTLAADSLRASPPPARWLGAPANVLEVAAAAAVVRWLTGPSRPLETLRGTAGFVLGGVLASNALTAVLGASLLRLTYGASFRDYWLNWWLGDGLGMLVAAPAVVALVALWRDRAGRRLPPRFAESFGLCALIALVLQLAFARPGALNPSLAVFAFPFLIVAALRLGLAAHLAVALASVIVLVHSA